MADLLSQVCPGAASDGLSFTGQDINPETEGRPDLVASDSLGVRLVVEAKFDAELTPAQTSGAYLQKLSPGVPGSLVFLVPTDRMRNVWATVSVTPGGATNPTPLPPGMSQGGPVFMPLSETGQTLAVVSWDALLNQIGSALEKTGDPTGAGELAQIRGLVEWRSRTGWAPLVSDDLPQRAGRQLLALTDLVRSVSSRASVGRVRNGTADGGPGRHLTTPSGKSLWLGVYYSWWDKYGPGPLWAQVKLKSVQQLSVTSEAMTGAGVPHLSRPEFGDLIVPLALLQGAERDVVEADVLAQLNAVIGVLDGLTVEVVTDEPGDGFEVETELVTEAVP